MSDTMKIQPFDVLLRWILSEYETRQSIFGIHRSLFHIPRPDAPYSTPDLFGRRLGTPIGPAAGPHTQLAQNIICAWLSGGRFIELKTVQIMDHLEIPRPCIDMEDEGYNVEWSQELRLGESVEEYVKAWSLIHLLPRLLGFDDRVPFDTIFNMSVGYNLEGIQSPPMVRFMNRLADASESIAPIREILRQSFPQYADIEIPSQITNSVTLSTMHGCPPDEIERIARYMIEERGLHTTVKLNPTLLGKDRVFNILHDRLGFTEMNIPDSAFEHDLKYSRAIELIKSLKQSAMERKLTFGVKLSNTLAMKNHRAALPGQEMYMSGRALYPLTINLFDQLMREFKGDLKVSYSAGADALNATSILSCGALPVTVASDILKPGGYSRCLQYLENLEVEMKELGATNLGEFSHDAMDNVARAAADALQNPRYKKSYRAPELPKEDTPLGLFDCITAPCSAKCPVHQDVPEYAWLIARGEYDRALESILVQNPLPGITGYVCTHICQTRCTRSNYEEPVAIRALKRVAFEKGRAGFGKINPTDRSDRTDLSDLIKPAVPSDSVMGSSGSSGLGGSGDLGGSGCPGGSRVAIIGAGPSGLAAASFLALHGVRSTIFEAKDKAGGMTAIAPVFRLPAEVIREDVDRIVAQGVEIKYSHPITSPPEELLKQGYDAVYVACGFAKDAPLAIEGIQSRGVFTALDLLEKTVRGERPDLGSKALVVGGGNTAMDAARTARRLTGKSVTVVYRRTIHEMPADEEERADLLDEGNTILELTSPVRVIAKDGRATALECLRNKLGDLGPDGRRKPVPIEGSNFLIEADSIIVAIGQSPDVVFLNGSAIRLRKDGAIEVDSKTQQTGLRRVYSGGDAVRGPSTIIQSCADGRRAAVMICRELGIQTGFDHPPIGPLSETEIVEVKRARTRKEARRQSETIPLTQRDGFDLVEQTLTPEAARVEALRCLQCSSFCDKCVEVCPNRANLTYFVEPLDLTLPRLVCRNSQTGKSLSPGSFSDSANPDLIVSGSDIFNITQSRQILHLDDLCNECGNCETFCVHQGKPYREKPRLFFKECDFLKEQDNAFLIQRGNGKSSTPNPQSDVHNQPWLIRRCDAGVATQLLLYNEGSFMIFDAPCLRGAIALPDFRIRNLELKQDFEGEFSMIQLAEMYMILKGAVQSLAYLPMFVEIST